MDPEDPRLKQRPIWGLLILALPVVGVAVTFVLYAGMLWLGLSGRGASGDPIVLAFDACPEARPLLAARLQDMGLTDAAFEAQGDGVMITLTPTGDAEVDAQLPETLAMPGALQIRGGDLLLGTNADLIDATVRLDLMMTPSVLLRLKPPAAERLKDHVRSDPGGQLRFLVDGVQIGTQSNRNSVAVGELEIASLDHPGDRALMRAVAAWSVVLDHGPLPCAVQPR